MIKSFLLFLFFVVIYYSIKFCYFFYFCYNLSIKHKIKVITPFFLFISSFYCFLQSLFLFHSLPPIASKQNKELKNINFLQSRDSFKYSEICSFKRRKLIIKTKVFKTRNLNNSLFKYCAAMK